MDYFKKINFFNIKKNKFFKPEILIVAFFCFLFFILSSILPYWQNNQDFLKFFSPDENANYIFTKLFQESGNLDIYEKYNLIADDIVRPRSYFSYQGFLKPVSFLGMTIIYGSIAKIFGHTLIPFLTPFFAALTLFFYYLLIKLLFGRKNALVSFFILFSFPVLFYYSARSMFHNVLFLSFFVIAAYFLIYLFQKYPARLGADRKKYYNILFSFDFLYSALSGLFFGLAIAVRTSELVWLAPAGLLLFILKRKKISFFRVSVFLSFLFLALLPIFYYNQALYGSPFFGGYYEMNKSIEEISSAGGAFFKSFFLGYFFELKNYIKIIFNTIFYFGFHPRQSLEMFNRYCISMFWYIFWPAISATFYLLFFDRKVIKKNCEYILSWILLSVILVLYYGSWLFVDNPDPNRFTIGNSYTRYWLPIYIGIIPLASIFVLNFYKIFFFLKNKKIYLYFKKILPFIFVLIINIISWNFVYQGSEEGLKYYFGKTIRAKQESLRIFELTKDSSVIITEYHDKFLFPERKVIVGRFNDNNMNHNYYKLAKLIDVYYYNFTLPENDFNYLNNRRLKEFGLRIDLVENFPNNFSLYKININ